MNWYKIAQKVTEPNINGSIIDIFHRTRSQDVVGNICESGFLSGAGQMYGSGIYANYTMNSAMGKYGLGTYGGIIIKGKLDLNGFIIFDYNIAKQVYGSNYRLPHQLQNVLGFGILNYQNINKAKKILWGYHKTLRNNPRITSDIAKYFLRSFPAIKNNSNGILFTEK